MTQTDRQIVSTNIRGVDPELWRRLKAEAALRSKPLSQLLNEILRPALANLEAARNGRHTSTEIAHQAGFTAGRGRK